MNYIVYQAYGKPEILNEAIFSILSYIYTGRQPGVQVLVYTDDAAYFERSLGPQPDIHYEVIAPAQWQAWRGSIDFVHRVKIEVLRHALHKHSGQFLYLDTDTILQQPVNSLFARLTQGQRLMHLAEGSLATGNYLNKKIYRQLKHHTWHIGGKQQTLPGRTTMYNAGVLGLTSTDAPLLDDVLALTEQLYTAYPKHVMEQLAFSFYLARENKVYEATREILHYWNLKEIRPTLAEFLTVHAGSMLTQLAQQAAQLPIAALAAEKIRQGQQPGWQRTLAKLLGRRWQLPAVLVPPRVG